MACKKDGKDALN